MQVVIGAAIGFALFIMGIVVGANWYEYRTADQRTDIPAWEAHGWQSVPAISDPRIMRRPRWYMP
jgi:hypothetical protein